MARMRHFRKRLPNTLNSCVAQPKAGEECDLNRLETSVDRLLLSAYFFLALEWKLSDHSLQRVVCLLVRQAAVQLTGFSRLFLERLPIKARSKSIRRLEVQR